MAKAYAGKKLIFLHSRKVFHICRVSTFKLYAEGKSFTDYILTIVAEIYIIFRSELTRQMNNRPYSLGTDRSNDESVIKKLNPVSIRLFGDITKALFDKIYSILRERNMDWKNCVAVGLGKTAVNVAKNSCIMHTY